MALRIRISWYHGWNIVAVCVVAQMAALGVMANCFTFFLEGWSREFHMPISTLVLAITLFSVVASLTSPFCGWLVSRFPVRRVMITGILGVIAGHILIGFARSGWQIIGIYTIILPLAVSLSCGVATQTLVSRWFVRRRGLAFSFCALGLVAAGVIFPPVVVWLLGKLGWRETWWIFAALYTVFVISLMLLFLRERPEEEEGRYYIVAEPHAHIDQPGTALTTRKILGRRNFWLTLAVFVPVILVNSALSINLAPFAQERGLSVGEAAALVALFNCAAAVGKLGAGTLADRFGNRAPLILLSAVTTIGTIALAFVSDMVPIAIGFSLLGLGQGLWVLLASCMAAEFGSADFPRAYGLASAGSVVTTLAAPALAFVAEQTHSYTPGLLAMGVFCLVSVVASYCFVNRAGTGKGSLPLADQPV